MRTIAATIVGCVLVACGDEGTEPCQDGFGRAEDGNCYPLSGDDDDDTGAPTEPPTETDTTPAHTGTPGSTFTGPVLVMTADIQADCGRIEVTFDVTTQGLTSGGLLYEIETGNSAPWADEHDLTSYEFDPYGAWDKLALTLVTDASVGDWARNESTIFPCSRYTGNGLDVMTFAVAVEDLNGDLADCLTWGEDPRAVVSGSITSPYNYELGPSFDTSNCVIGETAR